MRSSLKDKEDEHGARCMIISGSSVFKQQEMAGEEETSGMKCQFGEVSADDCVTNGE